jgi:hypothetical protein
MVIERVASGYLNTKRTVSDVSTRTQVEHRFMVRMEVLVERAPPNTIQTAALLASVPSRSWEPKRGLNRLDSALFGVLV